MSRNYFTWKEEECYKEGRRDAEYHRSSFEHSEYSGRSCDMAYFEGRQDYEREERQERERREEEEQQERMEEDQMMRRREEERQMQEEMYYQDYPEQEFYPEDYPEPEYQLYIYTKGDCRI